PNQGAAAGDETGSDSRADGNPDGTPAGTRAARTRSASSSTRAAGSSTRAAGARATGDKPTRARAAGTKPAGTRTPSKARRASSKASGESDAQLRAFYRDMLLIRRFEERAARAYTEALIGGYCHLNLGEEAAVVGLMAALKPTDYLFTNYRE